MLSSLAGACAGWVRSGVMFLKIRFFLIVTVMSSRSHVGGLVLLPHFIEHLLPELHHKYVM
jgi:hypothetical protein